MFLLNFKPLRPASFQKGLNIMPFSRKIAFRRYYIESGQFQDKLFIRVEAHLRFSFAVAVYAFF